MLPFLSGTLGLRSELNPDRLSGINWNNFNWGGIDAFDSVLMLYCVYMCICVVHVSANVRG